MFVVAFYELDRDYGGPEEGGWYFTTGSLVRVFKVARTKERATALAARADRLLNYLQRNKRSLGSALYIGGRHTAMAYARTAPEQFPQQRPHYE